MVLLLIFALSFFLFSLYIQVKRRGHKKQVIRVTQGTGLESEDEKKEERNKKEAISRVRVSSCLYAICLAFVCPSIHYVSQWNLQLTTGLRPATVINWTRFIIWNICSKFTIAFSCVHRFKGRLKKGRGRYNVPDTYPPFSLFALFLFFLLFLSQTSFIGTFFTRVTLHANIIKKITLDVWATATGATLRLHTAQITESILGH